MSLKDHQELGILVFWGEGKALATKKYSHNLKVKSSFIQWEFLGFQARKTASKVTLKKKINKVTLRELPSKARGRVRVYRSFAARGT